MSVSATSATGSTATTTASTTSKITADKDTFLKLLITQLQNQDPMNPMEDKEFISQLAQFTSLEKLSAINETLANSTAATTAQQAISMVGKTATVLDPDTGGTLEGTVSSVRILGDGSPTVTINSQEYPMSWVAALR